MLACDRPLDLERGLAGLLEGFEFVGGRALAFVGLRRLGRRLGLRLRTVPGRGFLGRPRLARRGFGLLGCRRGSPDFVQPSPGRARGPTRPARPPVDLGVRGALCPFFFGDERLPIGDGDLIIVRMDFAEREEPVAVAAVIDESRLERRLDPGYFGKIDVAFQLPAVCRLEIEFLHAIAAYHDHPSLLRVCRVDEHLIGH